VDRLDCYLEDRAKQLPSSPPERLVSRRWLIDTLTQAFDQMRPPEVQERPGEAETLEEAADRRAIRRLRQQIARIEQLARLSLTADA